MKLRAFPYMHQECQAFEQLPDWKKCPIDLSHYNTLLSKEKRCKQYKEKLSARALDLKMLDQIEAALTFNKEKIEQGQKASELQQFEDQATYDVIDLNSVFVCEAETEVYVSEAGLTIQSNDSDEQCELLNNLISDPTFVEFDLGDLFNSQPMDKTFLVDASDHMYAAFESCTEHQYAQFSVIAPEIPTSEKENKMVVVERKRKKKCKGRGLGSKQKDVVRSHVRKTVKSTIKCVVTKAKEQCQCTKDGSWDKAQTGGQ